MTRMVVCATTVLLAATVASASAAEPGSGVLRIHGGVLGQGPNGPGFRSGYDVGVAYDPSFHERWSAGAGVALHQGEWAKDWDATVMTPDVHVRYAWPFSAWSAFLSAGLGLYAIDPDDHLGLDASGVTKFGLPAGAGVGLAIGGPWVAELEAKHHFVITDGPSIDDGGDAFTYFTVGAAVGYRFGGR